MKEGLELGTTKRVTSITSTDSSGNPESALQSVILHDEREEDEWIMESTSAYDVTISRPAETRGHEEVG